MRAVNIIENVRGKNPGDESFWPLWEKCEQYGLPLFLKNVDTISERMTDTGASQMNIISNPVEATIAATSLMLSGALDAFPKLDVYMPHAGGFFAFVAPRIDHSMKNNNGGRFKMKQPATDYMRAVPLRPDSAQPEADADADRAGGRRARRLRNGSSASDGDLQASGVRRGDSKHHST